MEVKMNKEIRDYQESMFFGLNFRQCAFSVLAILAAVAIYFGTKGRLPDDVQGWLCMLGAAPFAACGFFKYHGMTAEQFLWAFIKSEILYPKKLKTFTTPVWRKASLRGNVSEVTGHASPGRKKMWQRKKQ